VIWSEDAYTILRDLVAGADDHRAWWIPDEIAGRARDLIARHAADEPPAQPEYRFTAGGLLSVDQAQQAAAAAYAKLTGLAGHAPEDPGRHLFFEGDQVNVVIRGETKRYVVTEGDPEGTVWASSRGVHHLKMRPADEEDPT